VKLRGLDLYCGAGGCSEGYARAGFEMTGVDLYPQPRYPYPFVLADALEYVAEYGHEYDFIHASPPCQRHSQASKCWNPDVLERHPEMIAATRRALQATGRPYVIENVPGARLHMLSPVTLCGVMFGLKVYRHRLFESNMLLSGAPHLPHPERVPLAGRGASAGGYISVAGNFADVRAARAAMGIDWMTRDELSQAIPPAYTEHIGRQLLWHLEGSAA
jgi:DNA (cytosine-5)-methyltransferase 1